MQLSHSSLNPLAFESVSIASPPGCSLVRFRSQKLASFQLHRHLHGLALGDFDLALRGLLGEKAHLSSSTVARLKEQWQAEWEVWQESTLE